MGIQDILKIAAIDTVLGMGTVFAVLIIISLCIWGIGIVFKQEEPTVAQAAPPTKASPGSTAHDGGTDEELVAVITAAISQYIRNRHGEEAAEEGRYIVRNIRRR